MTLLDFFLVGIIGGISPGPITALLLGETFRNGVRSGIQVPLALIFTNIFFGVFSVSLIFLGASITDKILLYFPYIGGAVFIYMGISEWRSSGRIDLTHTTHPFRKTLLMDVLNPHPYIFWFTILAAPIVAHLKESDWNFSLLAWGLFIVGLCGTKSIISLTAHAIRPYLKDHIVRIILKVLAVALVFFGIKLLFL